MNSSLIMKMTGILNTDKIRYWILHRKFELACLVLRKIHTTRLKSEELTGTTGSVSLRFRVLVLMHVLM